jgi:hypothetical protein
MPRSTTDTEEALVELVTPVLAADDVALLVGSAAVGLTQASSDLDVYVVVDDPGHRWSEAPRRIPRPDGATAVEVEWFTTGALLAEAETVRAAAGGAGSRLRSLRQEMLLRYSALVTGRVIADPSVRWPALREALAPTAYQLVAERWHRAWVEALDELAGFAVELGSFELADAAVRAAAAHWADAEVVARGELYFSPKYRFEMAERSGVPATAMDEVWRLLAWQPLSPPSLRGALADLRALTGLPPRPAPSRLPRTLRLSPAVELLEVDGEAFLVEGEHYVRTTPSSRAVFAALRRTEDLAEVLEQAQRSGGDGPAGLRELLESGVLRAPAKVGRWATGV